MKKTLLVILCMFGVGSANTELAASPWIVSELALRPLNNQYQQISFHVARSDGVSRLISSEVILTAIDSSFVEEDKFAVLGEAGRTQAVVIFDLGSGKESDWFFCYEPQRIDRNWIAFVEFYPAHSTGQPTDVILVYDLTRSPVENRIDQSGPLRLPPNRGDYPVRVGIPVFPDSNAKRRSYVNEVTSTTDSVQVLGPPFLLLLSSKRLVFLETTGTDYYNYVSHLVAVDLSRGLGSSQSQVIPIPMDRLPRSTGNPKFLRALKLEEVSPTEVRLKLSKADYGVDSLVVNIANSSSEQMSMRKDVKRFGRLDGI